MAEYLDFEPTTSVPHPGPKIPHLVPHLADSISEA